MELTLNEIVLERGQRIIAAPISAVVKSGGYLAIRGPNGAGKSTLLRVIADLLPPKSGTVTVTSDPDMAPVPRRELMHYFGHLDGLKASMTARENLTFYHRLLHLPDQTNHGMAVTEALDAVALPHVLDVPISYLSAGMRKRVAFARLLVVNRPIWLLDEPTSALDAASVDRMGALMQTHLSRSGMILAATHLPLPGIVQETLEIRPALSAAPSQMGLDSSMEAYL